MNGKRIIGLFLLTSFNLHCMLTVKPVRRKNGGKIPRVIKTDSATSSVKKYIEEIKENEKCIASENYEHNKHNFFVVNGDIPTQVVTHLDHLSNIQLIRSSKHLYEKHRKQAPDGTIIYSNCLFTKLPIPFESHTRAMFHYAALNKKQAEMLLEIEDTDGSRLAMLRNFSIDASDHNTVMNFYQQNFSSAYIHYMLRDPMFLQIMLKRGVSPNIADEKGRTLLMYSIAKDNALELLDILLKHPCIDINVKNKDGITAFRYALVIENAAILNVLLKHPNLDINTKDNDGVTAGDFAIVLGNPDILTALLNNAPTEIAVSSFAYWYNIVNMYRQNPEVTRLLSQRTSFSTKVKLPAILCMWVAGCMLYHKK